jgi:DNA primase
MKETMEPAEELKDLEVAYRSLLVEHHTDPNEVTKKKVKAARSRIERLRREIDDAEILNEALAEKRRQDALEADAAARAEREAEIREIGQRRVATAGEIDEVLDQLRSLLVSSKTDAGRMSDLARQNGAHPDSFNNTEVLLDHLRHYLAPVWPSDPVTRLNDRHNRPLRDIEAELVTMNPGHPGLA